ncbi:class I SAM-dependent methyltransferase [Paenibacillus sedimenti]|uniref:Methyltransferase domain-containing protein n=1 Tax=Paenibacillus sedimenti TaxID=2770274 RepID=A0A926KPH9_9BACL|nr:class I SAM-dependent methyltransferase [Paenibacillus sedimenti]MBD0381634.1 methyltransferase domain-containing protein [Paenibacillus sedimenti]
MNPEGVKSVAWYQKSFGNDYLIVYKHRDLQGAYHEVKKMMDWLNLPQGAQVLDLCCGMGRHSIALSEFGYEVTGVDLSEVLLAEAVKMDVKSQVKWHQGDMRKVPLDHTFDAVVNLFTSFGYFDEDSQNEQVFHEIHRLLKPNGRFIIDFLNPVFVQENLVPQSERSENGLTIRESRSIEEGHVRKRIVISQEGEPDRHYLEQVKLYDRASFESMLLKAGLHIDHVYGGYDGQQYIPASSSRMIFIGHREG